MASQNFFALLEEDETDDISGLIARAEAASLSAPSKDANKKLPPQPSESVAKLPSKPLPPAQAVREAQADGGRGRGSGGGGGRGSFTNRGRGYEGSYNRPNRDGAPPGDQGDYGSRNGNGFQGGRGGYKAAPLNGDIQSPADVRQSDGFRGRGRGRSRGRGFDGEERSGRREYDRRSGSGHGSELKREGAGRGNWGTEIDQNTVQDIPDTVIEEDKPALTEGDDKKLVDEPPTEPEDAEKKKEAEAEEKEMTLEEYEKILTEKRKALEALKSQERKVALDKDFESMQLVDKRVDDEVFLKLGADKVKRKEVSDKEDKARKHVSINEFLRPAEGEGYARRGRGGRGRGGARGDYGGGFGNSGEAVMAPRIEDPGQFPTLGAK